MFFQCWSLFLQPWHSLHRQLMSWVIPWKCQHFLVELLSPQTSSHPSCTAHCGTRAGANLCLAAMSQQAQELPGWHHFSRDSSQTVFKTVFWRAKNISPALWAAFPIVFIQAAVYTPWVFSWLDQQDVKIEKQGPGSKMLGTKCQVRKASESRTKVFPWYHGGWILHRPWGLTKHLTNFSVGL